MGREIRATQESFRCVRSRIAPEPLGLSNAAQSSDSATLRDFLRSARARIAPESVGLPPRARRRVPGLSAEQLAELIGVSDVWYSRFEAGRAKFSMEALRRLAEVLRLNEVERKILFSHARPNLARTFAGSDDASQVLREHGAFRRVLRRLSAASSFAELATAAATILAELEPHYLTYLAEHFADSEALDLFGWTYLALNRRREEGPFVGMVERYRPGQRAASHAVALGRTDGVSDMMLAGAAERDISEQRSARSWCATALSVGDRMYALGFANQTPYSGTPLSIARLEMVATTCEALAT